VDKQGGGGEGGERRRHEGKGTDTRKDRKGRSGKTKKGKQGRGEAGKKGKGRKLKEETKENEARKGKKRGRKKGASTVDVKRGKEKQGRQRGKRGGGGGGRTTTTTKWGQECKNMRTQKSKEHLKNSKHSYSMKKNCRGRRRKGKEKGQARNKARGVFTAARDGKHSFMAGGEVVESFDDFSEHDVLPT
jgi:hypothetical protein